MYLPSPLSGPPTAGALRAGSILAPGSAGSSPPPPNGGTASSPATALGLLNNGPLPQGSKLMAYMNNRGPPPMMGSGSPHVNGSPAGSHELNTSQSIQALESKANLTGDDNRGLGRSSVQTSVTATNINHIQEFVPASATSSTGSGSAGNGVMGLRQPHSSGGNGRLYSRSPVPSAHPAPGNGADSEGSVARISPTSMTPEQQAALEAVATFSDGGTTYFFSGDEMPMSHPMSSQGLNSGTSTLLPDYSAYSGTPSFVANMRVRANIPGFLADSEIRIDILKRQQICWAQIDMDQHPGVPSEVDNFKELCPLESVPQSPTMKNKSHTFGYYTTVYKAANMKTGVLVCLRRIHGYRLLNTKCMMLVEQWRKLSHPNLVSLRQVFTTKSFGDHSMVFVYDLYPGAETLMEKHFSHPAQTGNAFMDPFSGTDGTARPYSQQKNQMLRQQAMLTNNGLLAESVIWSYVIQLTSALRHIHSAGLACRTLDPTKILIINKSRLLLNCGGIFDVITFDAAASNPMGAMAHYQQEDLVSLGKIVLALACNSFLAIQRENLQTSMEIVTSTYSTDLRNLIMYLLTNPNRVKSVNDLMPMIGARFYTHLDAAYARCDSVESELSKEVESSRLFRLSTKISTVVDRAELNGDFGWAEYGDRYMLKLFRDYVFHQVMEDNRPWLDMAHVITCLNKLDAGSSERVCLMSRDEQNVLVVSYAELKLSLEQSFSECVQASRMPPNPSGHSGAMGSHY
ncbi:hypothetical protein TCAL_01718 [Tigriopus californicus]|uniref:PAN2-PAN3 deadenylation complex subunit PAN3 n=1 Tax=Tigriopus californicus TaxID=6832 RepID=A0A553PKW4_TIGCA|nr:PAN2-PAN3 deadenylation complex subunit Pan3-like [Tigriopus californicus]XP_059095998.1 PAN2-PAN3 deadenylation complex subunit Pan3-like [Tigriopus californicus]XP_059095999.1 PAN2-PAN3 deadenylation complex subunit Pan3-like [Tigriopus californicus]TRY78299.1 hypothetical protein TCAL_01718 [Tigriopus californicus]|eukprot:TCALIF_01718-PA protein Name:"Similar to pan3 PAB-dependent poly(A)-specific ribonuclease subunit PAN3 (Xenopus tropicalis)" AED:0.21 eAED:0.21 QI:212/1/1/1/1/1/8/1091/741